MYTSSPGTVLKQNNIKISSKLLIGWNRKINIINYSRIILKYTFHVSLKEKDMSNTSFVIIAMSIFIYSYLLNLIVDICHKISLIIISYYNIFVIS